MIGMAKEGKAEAPKMDRKMNAKKDGLGVSRALAEK
jgi:hypothetical protein